MNLEQFATFFVVMMIVAGITSFVPNFMLQLLLMVVTFGGYLFVSWPREGW